MKVSRRSFVRSTLVLLTAGSASIFAPARRAWAKTASVKIADNDGLDQAIAQEIGARKLAESDAIRLETPQVAEDGAVVPVTVESSLPDVEVILIFVEKNPTPLVARFSFDKSMDAFVSLRIKMNETCDVVAVVGSGGAFFSTRKRVKVVVGGCG